MNEFDSDIEDQIGDTLLRRILAKRNIDLEGALKLWVYLPAAATRGYDYCLYHCSHIRRKNGRWEAVRTSPTGRVR